MNNVSRTYAVSTPPPCAWSADDCYPAKILHWLQQQARQPEVKPMDCEAEAELEIV